jgi:hypothetical protein
MMPSTAPQPLLGLLAGNNGFITLLLGLLPVVSLDRQFVCSDRAISLAAPKR